jgi:hypothetical protein
MRICLLLSIVVFVYSVQVYQKVTIADKSALCLDGTPAVYYYSKGSSSKMLLYFEGGGWCGNKDLASTLESCYQRSKTDLGSSKNYAATISVYDGILSDNSQNYFKDWSKVFIKYCTGTGHQGTRQ